MTFFATLSAVRESGNGPISAATVARGAAGFGGTADTNGFADVPCFMLKIPHHDCGEAVRQLMTGILIDNSTKNV
jgi:hypothetical protein